MTLDNPSLFTNPYRPSESDETPVIPFTGRIKAFEHLYHQLTDPSSAGVSVILGRRDIGKTALLKHFNSYFDDTFLGVYITLLTQTIRSESDWLNVIALNSMQMLSNRDFSLYKLPKQNAEDGDMRRWMTDEYLPHTLEIIRGRRLVWLIDDAGSLVQWAKDGKLPTDHFAYLDGLVKHYQNLGIVLALDSRYEMNIQKMNPLVQVTDVYRLANLSEEENKSLLQQPVQNQFRVSDEAAAAVYQATGGQPRLVQRFGSALYEHQQDKNLVTANITAEDVKTISAVVQKQSDSDFQKVWAETGRNGQLLLTAITRLMLLDPLTPVTTSAIANWLIESDFPLDTTTINSALRGLEYDELIENGKAGIRLKSSLMQNWLLQYAELQTVGKTISSSPRRGLLVALVLLVLVVAALAFVVTQQRTDEQTITNTLQPTLTLVTSP